MQGYDDFALPTIENIEKMAKEYQKYKEEKNAIQYGNNRQVLLEVYENVYNLGAYIDFLYNKDRSNDSAQKLYNIGKKIKLKIDGFTIDINKPILKKFVPKEERVLLNIIECCKNILMLYLQNLKDDNLLFFAIKIVEVLDVICEH